MSKDTTVLDSEPATCPHCGRRAAADSPMGICPACLLARAIEGPGAADPAGEQDSRPASLPTRIGDYEIIEAIAEGGMGIVCRARDLRLHRIVALKMIASGHLAGSVEVGRFLIESRAVARLEHPNIVPIYEVGEEGGRHFFTMKLVEGGSLASRLASRTGPWEAQVSIRLVAKLARAVHFAHERGILHRDIKPGNILLDAQGEPHLTDFGLARIAGQDAALTRPLTVMGSVHYMAPEQARGLTRELTTAVDVYGLGVVLYELLTGRVPLRGETMIESLRKVAEDPPARPSLLNPLVDRDLDTICLKCLEKQPLRRYRSAEDLALDLERWERHEPVLARPASRLERTRLWIRRKPASAALLGVIALAATALVVTRVQHATQLAGRMHELLIEQSQAERLLGHRAAALRLVGEAAATKRSPALLAEAIQAVTAPGARLAFEVPFGGIGTMRFSPDASLCAVGGEVPVLRSNTIASVPRVRVYAVPTGQLVGESEWDARGGPFAFSPDSRVLAVPQGGSSIALWQPQTGAVLKTIPLLGAPLFSPDGRRLAVDAATGVSVFDMATGRREFHRPGRATLRAFTGPENLLLQEWPRRTGSELWSWNFVAGTELPITPTGATALVSGDGRVAGFVRPGGGGSNAPMTLIDTATGVSIASVPAVQGGVAGLPSPDGRRIAFGSATEAGRFAVWDVPSAQWLAGVGEPGAEFTRAFEGYSGRAGSLSVDRGDSPQPSSPWLSAVGNFSHDGSLIACESRFGERDLTLWNPETGQRLGTLPGAGRPVWSQNDRWLAVAHDGVFRLEFPNLSQKQSGRVLVQIWEVSHGTPTARLPAMYRSLAFSADGRQLAAENTLWNVEARGDRRSLKTAFSIPRSDVIRFAGNTPWAVDASPYRSSGRMHFHQMGAATNQFDPIPFGLGRSHAFSPDGHRVLIACSADPKGAPETTVPNLQLWDLKDLRRLAVWARPAQPAGSAAHVSEGPVAFSPDGNLAAVGCFQDQGLEIWDVSTGRQVSRVAPTASEERIYDERRVEFCAFAPDNRLLVYGGADQLVIRTLPASQVVARIRPGTNSINQIALSRDGRTLVTATEDRMIRLWETATGHALAAWPAHAAGVCAVTFSPDGNLLASGGKEGAIRLWDLPAIRRELRALGLDWQVD